MIIGDLGGFGARSGFEQLLRHLRPTICILSIPASLRLGLSIACSNEKRRLQELSRQKRKKKIEKIEKERREKM